MRKPCKNCPFKRSSPLIGSPDWLKDVMNFYKKNKFFVHSCHKSDPMADGYKGGKKKIECAGWQEMMINEIDGTPGKGGVYDSIKEMGEKYLRHWLGDEEFEAARRKAGV